MAFLIFSDSSFILLFLISTVAKPPYSFNGYSAAHLLPQAFDIYRKSIVLNKIAALVPYTVQYLRPCEKISFVIGKNQQQTVF